MDNAILNLLNGLLFRHDGIEDPVLLYEKVSLIIFIAILVGLFMFARRDRRADARRAAVAAGVATALALVVGQLISRAVDRPRPFITDPTGVHLFAAHAADAGFPSDHATATFAIAAAIFLRDRRLGAIVFCLAAIVSIGRIGIGVHFPSDVLAGAILGSLAALSTMWSPIRSRTDSAADWIGNVVDRIARVGARSWVRA